MCDDLESTIAELDGKGATFAGEIQEFEFGRGIMLERARGGPDPALPADAPDGLRPLSVAADFFARSVHEVAPDLIGVALLVDGVGGRIVEVEAYDSEDPAAHGFRGRTPRNASMFGPPGHAYVYRSYGIHWCLNLVCEEEGSAAAVLIRALEPTDGARADAASGAGSTDARLLAAGPGRLCEALGVTREHDGLSLAEPPFELRAPRERPEVVSGTRIGISVAVEQPWRYAEAGSRWLSRPLRSPATARRPA